MRYDVWVRKDGVFTLAKSELKGKEAIEQLAWYSLSDSTELNPTIAPTHWRSWIGEKIPEDVEVAAISRDSDGDVVTVLSSDGKQLTKRFLSLVISLVESGVVADAAALGIVAAHLKAIACDLGGQSEDWFSMAQCGDLTDTAINDALHAHDAAYWRQTLRKQLWSTEWRNEVAEEAATDSEGKALV